MVKKKSRLMTILELLCYHFLLQQRTNLELFLITFMIMDTIKSRSIWISLPLVILLNDLQRRGLLNKRCLNIALMIIAGVSKLCNLLSRLLNFVDKEFVAILLLTSIKCVYIEIDVCLYDVAKLQHCLRVHHENRYEYYIHL